jgi:hypothetical protein
MADKFRIGQKVRVIKSKFHPELIGEVITITGKREWHKSPFVAEKWFGYSVDLNFNYYPPEDYLEPVYDGDTASNWSECAWKPDWIKSHG